MIDFNKPHLRVVGEFNKDEIKARLESDIRNVVRQLYPQVRITSGSKDVRIADPSGDAGNSMSIALTPDVPGQWIDHATGEKGDVLTLIERALGLTDFKDVLREANALAGGTVTSRQSVHRAEQETKPKPKPKIKIGEVSYPYLSVSGEPIVTVYKYLYENAKKEFRMFRHSDEQWKAPDVRPLFNLPGLTKTDTIVFVEGEKCAQALIEQGITATCIMGGAKAPLDKNDWSPLAGKQVIIWPDNDEPGFGLAGRVKNVLNGLVSSVRVVDVPNGKPDGWDAADAIEAGEDVTAYLETIQPTFLEEIDALAWNDIDYVYEGELVDDILPRTGVATVFGPSTAGKSFVCLDWAVSIASGGKVLDHDTEQAAIAYCAFEGFSGLKRRIYGIQKHRNIRDIPVTLIDAPWNLTDEEHYKDFVAQLRDLKDAYAEQGERLGLVIVDTLTNATAGSETNAQADVTLAMKRLKRTSTDLDLLILNVGHTGKDETRGMVGSFAYKSEADAFIEIRAERDELTSEIKSRSVFIDKVKDGPSGYVASEYNLDIVHLGDKPNGKPLTTCLVSWKRPKSKLEKQNEAMMNHATRVLFELNTGPKSIKQLGAAFSLSRPRMREIISWMEDNGQISFFMDGRMKMWEKRPSVGEGADR
jgi:hypothetical protein